jgi:hypothetical protein
MPGLTTLIEGLGWFDLVMLAQRQSSPWVAAFPLSILTVVLSCHAIGYVNDRRRRRGIGAALEAMRFQVSMSPDGFEQSSAFDTLGTPWIDLKDGPTGVRWWARIIAEGHEISIVEHRHTTGRGKYKKTHYHTIAAIAAPSHWPEVSLTRENVLDKMGSLLGSRDLQVEDPAFNARWRVRAHREDFAFLLLSPEFQAWSMRLDPSRLSIRIGGRAITLCRHRRLDAAGCKSLIADCVELARLIPPELQVWERSSGRLDAAA